MKNNSAKGYAALGILFVLLSVIAFVLPTDKTATFWIAYGFSVVAFGAQLAIWPKALGKEEPLKSKFLGFPVISIGIVYLVVQTLAFVLFLLIPTLPSWSAIVVCALIAGISGVCLIGADIGGSEIKRVEEKVKTKVFYLKELQTEVELLADKEADSTIKAALTQLATKIRFSDPMSSPQLANLEATITAKVQELKKSNSKGEIITEITLLLEERNKKCKILK